MINSINVFENKTYFRLKNNRSPSTMGLIRLMYSKNVLHFRIRSIINFIIFTRKSDNL